MLPLPKLFGRTYKIVVGTLDITGLRASIDIKKTLKKEPNTCTIRIWNLSEEHRQELSDPEAVNVSVEMGYQNENSLLYLGQVRQGFSTVEGPDIVTTLSTGDGDKAIQQARINVPLGPKVPNGEALQAIAKTLGVGLGNTAAAAAKLPNAVSIFPVPTNLTGNSARLMTLFCKSAGLEWSIQDGKIQILDLGKSLDERPYILDEGSGLYGSPSLTYENKTGDKIVNATVAMLPGLRPGVRVQFDARFVKGLYRVEECNYKGDTFGDDWNIDLTCRLPKNG